jgi:hypothetical protein
VQYLQGISQPCDGRYERGDRVLASWSDHSCRNRCRMSPMLWGHWAARKSHQLVCLPLRL